MWFLPKDYVPVSKRVDQFHEKYPKWSIDTSFEINGNIVIFKTKVFTWENDRSFTWHSFWAVWKEKAFEKLESVSVGRALAFAWFETREWIASKEEMEIFADNQAVKPLDFDEYMTLIKQEDNIDTLRVFYKQASESWQFSTSQMEILEAECKKRADKIQNPAKYNTLPPI